MPRAGRGDARLQLGSADFAITVGGLNVRDVRTGELLWQSPGFAPRGCVNSVLADGRVFWPSAASGVVYCWEPVGPK